MGRSREPGPQPSKAFYRELFGWESYTLTFSGFDDYEIFTEGASGPGVAGVQALRRASYRR